MLTIQVLRPFRFEIIYKNCLRTSKSIQSFVDSVKQSVMSADCVRYMRHYTNGQCASLVDTAVVGNSISTIEPTNEGASGPATALCTPTLRSFSVQVDQQLERNERVGLVGDSKALGEWQLDRSITLDHKNGSKEWSGSIMLQACRTLNYRYFIYAEDQSGRKQIRRWETQFKPRSLSACATNCQQVDVFGQDSNGELQSNRGWITNEVIYQLKFERERMFQVHDIEQFDPENIHLRLVPLADDLKTPLDMTTSAVKVEVVKMEYGKSLLQKQQPMGVSHKRDDIVIFHVTVPKNMEPAFALVFRSADQKPMGEAIIRPLQLNGSEGELMLEIKDSKSVIARLILPYLVVKPFCDVGTLDFRATYAHYWPKYWPILDVGHRGNGKSYIANPPNERENTVASFLKAYEVFADMVELDVHLTADGVPVIYHDFGLRTAPQGKLVTKTSQLEYVLIKDVTYEALCKLRIFAVINSEMKEYPAHNSEPIVENRIFPRLTDVLQALPKTLGIDVEIKWPQQRKCGGVEAEQTIDKNFFVDRVLQTIIQKGCGRPLIFSSFDADICTMIRFKQNIFPVMFLTMGETKKWEPFLNLRTRTFEQALNNAQAFELAGTAPHAEDFVGEQGRAMMQKARDLDLISLVWGDDCNSTTAVKYFQDIGATATCYDRSDLYMPDTKKRAFFNSPTTLSEFEGQCRQ